MFVKNAKETVQWVVGEAKSKGTAIASKLVMNLNAYALPVIAIALASSMPKAEAGPLSYSACCISCTALAPPAVPACLALCAPVLFFPSP